MNVNDFGDAVDKYYTRFVFRDLLAYLLQGAIFLYLIWPVIPTALKYPDQFPVKLFWLGLILFAYALGRLLQDIGTWIPFPFEKFKYRLTILGIWDYLHPKEYFKKELMFLIGTEKDNFNKSNIGADYRLYRERINLLKLMSGNLSMAFLCASLIRLLFLPNNGSNNILLLSSLAAIAFWISHFSLVFQKCIWESVLIGKSFNKKYKTIKNK